MASLNTVALTGNLTRDPEVHEGEDFVKCKMRIAVHNRRKQGDEWGEDSHFFDVICFGRTAQNCGVYLAKGRLIGVSGRLQMREWETDDGQKRSVVEILANHVQFLGGGEEAKAEPPKAEAEALVVEGGDEEDTPF